MLAPLLIAAALTLPRHADLSAVVIAWLKQQS